MGSTHLPIGELYERVNDGQLHVVRFTRSGPNSTIQLDDNIIQTKNPQGQRHFTTLSLTTLKYFCINHGDQRVFEFKIIINVLVRSLALTMGLRPLYFLSFSEGTVCRRQNLTSADVSLWHLKAVPELTMLFCRNNQPIKVGHSHVIYWRLILLVKRVSNRKDHILRPLDSFTKFCHICCLNLTNIRNHILNPFDKFKKNMLRPLDKSTKNIVIFCLHFTKLRKISSYFASIWQM